MNRLKRPIRTDIPDWRDPNMRVLLHQIDKYGHSRLVSVSSKEATYIFNFRMEITEYDPSVPYWRDDPTYNLRKRK